MNGNFKKAIKDFKLENGNHFTQKDMLIYCIDRIDKVYDKLENGSSKIAKNRAGLKFLYWLNGMGIPILVSILVYLFTQLYNIK